MNHIMFVVAFTAIGAIIGGVIGNKVAQMINRKRAKQRFLFITKQY